MLSILKKTKNNTRKDARKLIFSPVHVEEITGFMYELGEMLPHARMTILTETSKAMAGVAYKDDETIYFVASNKNVISHIRSEGCVPLVQSLYLRFFKDKKRMNHYFAKMPLN